MTRSTLSKAYTSVYGQWDSVPNPAPSPPRQQRFLYTPIWTAAHDKVFVDSLWDQVTEGLVKEDGVVSDEALERVTIRVNLLLKESFTTKQNRIHLEKLRERFKTFRYLISCPEVIWDRWDNTMTAPSAFWECVVQMYPLPKAYEHFRDPNWTALDVIFGTSEVTAAASTSATSPDNENEVLKICNKESIVEIDGVLHILTDSE